MQNGITSRFARYVALGDSISIDDYPYLDLVTRSTARPVDVGAAARHAEVEATCAPEAAGAASLLYSNRDDLWPEFAGHDLSSRCPGIEFVDLAVDGATTWSVLAAQLPRLPRDDGRPTLVTLTAGGNDLLQLIAAAAPGSMEGLDRITENLDEILERIVSRYADVTVIAGTVYDPSDGTADLGRYQLTAADAPTRRQMLGWLSGYNQAVKRAAAATGCRVADIHAHFMGHGITEPDPLKRWYWEEMIIEPNARGASEVRRLWLGALGLDLSAAAGQR